MDNAELLKIPLLEPNKLKKHKTLILTRMLVFVSKSHRKGLKNYGKNIKTKFR